MLSLGNKSVEYNENGVVTKRNHFENKSKSMMRPGALKAQNSSYIDGLTRKSGSPQHNPANNSHDLINVLDKGSEKQLLDKTKATEEGNNLDTQALLEKNLS